MRSEAKDTAVAGTISHANEVREDNADETLGAVPDAAGDAAPSIEWKAEHLQTGTA